MKVLKNMEGITLISLVITIIVLIILAAVSISLVFDEDGIITRAKEAAENMEIAAKEEQEMLNSLYGSLGSFESSQGGLQGGTTVGGGTATASQVLEGVTFSSNLGKELLGTMKNNGAVTATIAPGETYTIPEGYHNGEGTVTASGSNGKQVVLLGDTGNTYDLTQYDGYENFTVDNFIIVTPNTNTSSGSHTATKTNISATATFTAPSVSYNETTGSLSTTNGGLKVFSDLGDWHNIDHTTTLVGKVYLYY